MISNLQIALILTIAFTSVISLSAVLGLGVISVVLMRESRKLEALGLPHKRIDVVATELANLRKEHVALEDIVAAQMNRTAVRQKRARDEQKQQRDESTAGVAAGLFFPSESGEAN